VNQHMLSYNIMQRKKTGVRMLVARNHEDVSVTPNEVNAVCMEIDMPI